jgi:hypothetical protein
MAKMEECLIHIDLANALKEVVDSMSLKPTEGFIGFSCPECHKSVKAMRVGTNGAAPHFEHLARNPQCSLSDERGT